MDGSTLVGCSTAVTPPRLAVMSALRRRVGRLVVPEEDDAAPERRSRRDWIVDGALFLLATAVGLMSVAGLVEKGLDGPLLFFDVCGGAALCLALWGRRRWPFGLGLASVPILAVSSFAGLAGAIILFTVAAYRRWQLAFLIAGLQLAVLPAYRAVHPEDDWLSTVAAYLVSTLGLAAIVGWGMFLGGRRQARRERLRRAQAEQQLRVEQIRYAERTRIAREMHDVLAHRISLLSLHAGALEFRPDAPAEEVARAAAVIRASAHQALEDLRAMIGLLRDGADGEAPQPPQPTLAALPGLLEESRAAGMRAQARDVGRSRPAPRGSSRGGTGDRGTQPGAGSGRWRNGDSRVGDRARRPGRAGHAHRRPPRARTRRGRQLPASRLAAVARVSGRIRVLVVDDDALVRAGLSMLLAGVEDIEIVGEATDGSQVAQAVAEHRPDVVLMDIRMPGMDGLAATELLRAHGDAPEVIVLTTFEADDYVLRALRAGASGFLVKDTPPADIVCGVRAVAAGEPMLS